MRLPPGSRLGPYEVVRDEGVVYLVRNPRQATLRELVPIGAAHVENARLLSRIRHPNVARIEDVFEAGGWWAPREVPTGTALADLAADPLSREEALDIFHQLCDAVIAAHGIGMVLGDLGPDRARLVEGKESVVVVVVGAGIGLPGGWRAPEAVMTEAADVWALGALLESLIPSADGALAQLIRRATADAPADRPASAGELQQAVRGVTAPPPVEAPPAPGPKRGELRAAQLAADRVRPPKPLRRPAQRLRWFAWAVPGALVGFLVGGAMLAAANAADGARAARTRLGTANAALEDAWPLHAQVLTAVVADAEDPRTLLASVEAYRLAPTPPERSRAGRHLLRTFRAELQNRKEARDPLTMNDATARLEAMESDLSAWEQENQHSRDAVEGVDVELADALGFLIDGPHPSTVRLTTLPGLVTAPDPPPPQRRRKGR